LEYTLGVLCPQGSARAGRPLNQNLVNIIDLQGLGWESRHFLAIFQKISEIDKVYYPCTMGINWIINAPSFFPYLYSVCKPFVDPYIVARMRVFSDDSYKADLLKEIDADQLPPEYGGTGKSQLPVVKEIDWAAIDAKKVEEAGQRMKLLEAEVPAGESRVIEKKVDAKDVSTESPVTLEIFFKTSNKDIKFSIEYQVLGGGKEVMIEPETFQSQTVPVLREVTINQPGTLRFVFDNTYSYFTPKYLTYGITMTSTTKTATETSTVS